MHSLRLAPIHVCWFFSFILWSDHFYRNPLKWLAFHNTIYVYVYIIIYFFVNFSVLIERKREIDRRQKYRFGERVLNIGRPYYAEFELNIQIGIRPTWNATVIGRRCRRRRRAEDCSVYMRESNVHIKWEYNIIMSNIIMLFKYILNRHWCCLCVFEPVCHRSCRRLCHHAAYSWIDIYVHCFILSPSAV